MKDLMFQTDTTIPRSQVPFLHIFGVPTNSFSFLKDAWHWHISRHSNRQKSCKMTWTGCKIMIFPFGTVFDQKAGHSLPTLWDHCIFRGTTQHRHLTETSILATCLVCSMYDKTSSVRTLWISGDDLLNAPTLPGKCALFTSTSPVQIFNFTRSPRVPGGSAVIASARGRRQNPQNLPVGCGNSGTAAPATWTRTNHLSMQKVMNSMVLYHTPRRIGYNNRNGSYGRIASFPFKYSYDLPCIRKGICILLRSFS